MALIEPARLCALLGDDARRFDVDAVDQIDSTNDELARRAGQGAGSGTVLVADRQSAGRGRRGRRWQSSPADSLTFSLLWRFSPLPPSLGGLSLAVGLALARALASLGLPGFVLKWPNDLLWQGADGPPAKVGGILIELASDRRGTQAVIGIGLNLRRPADDPGQPAAGLSDAGLDLPERHVLLAALLRELATVLDGFAVNGFAAWREAWQAVHAWQDQPVELVDDGTRRPGICRGVDEDGALLLETAAGLERILAGDLSLRRR